jgi:hypothetical protein
VTWDKKGKVTHRERSLTEMDAAIAAVRVHAQWNSGPQ